MRITVEKLWNELQPGELVHLISGFDYFVRAEVQPDNRVTIYTERQEPVTRHQGNTVSVAAVVPANCRGGDTYQTVDCCPCCDGRHVGLLFKPKAGISQGKFVATCPKTKKAITLD